MRKIDRVVDDGFNKLFLDKYGVDTSPKPQKQKLEESTVKNKTKKPLTEAWNDYQSTYLDDPETLEYVNGVIDNFDPVVLQVEKDEDGYEVQIGDKNSDFTAWIDVWKSGDDFDLDWNQYIFYLTNENDCIQKLVQEDPEVASLAFELAYDAVDSDVNESIMDEEQLNERGLTKAQRYNNMLNNVFDRHDKELDSKARFLVAHGVPEEEVKELRKHCGLGKDALDDKLNELGIRDDFYQSIKKDESLTEASRDKLLNLYKNKEQDARVKMQHNQFDRKQEYNKTNPDQKKLKAYDKEYNKLYGEKSHASAVLDQFGVSQAGEADIHNKMGKDNEIFRKKSKEGKDEYNRVANLNHPKNKELHAKINARSNKEENFCKSASLKEERCNYGHKGPWWYFTLHGVQPGSLPKGVNVLKVQEGENEKGTKGTFVQLDGVLTTQELKDFDIRELSPEMASYKRGETESLNGKGRSYLDNKDDNFKVVDEKNQVIKSNSGEPIKFPSKKEADEFIEESLTESTSNQFNGIIEIPKREADYANKVLALELEDEEELRDYDVDEDAVLYVWSCEYEDGHVADLRLCTSQREAFIDPILFAPSEKGGLYEACVLDVDFEVVDGSEYFFEDNGKEYVATVKIIGDGNKLESINEAKTSNEKRFYYTAKGQTYTFYCSTRKTRNGFAHDCSMQLRGEELSSAKATYMNRTWESFDYQTVLLKAVSNCSSIDEETKKILKDKINTSDIDIEERDKYQTPVNESSKDRIGKYSKYKVTLENGECEEVYAMSEKQAYEKAEKLYGKISNISIDEALKESAESSNKTPEDFDNLKEFYAWLLKAYPNTKERDRYLLSLIFNNKDKALKESGSYGFEIWHDGNFLSSDDGYDSEDEAYDAATDDVEYRIAYDDSYEGCGLEDFDIEITKPFGESLKESFWEPTEWLDKFVDIESKFVNSDKWNGASQEEREEMVLPAIKEYLNKYGESTVWQLFLDDLEDNNYHTERRLFIQELNK